MFRNTLMSLGLAIVALSTLTASGAEAKRHRRPTAESAAPAPSTATTKTFDKNGYYEIAMGTSDFVIIRYSGPIKAASMDDVKPVRARHKKK